MKILVTGGHVTPALAVIEKLVDCDVIFVGRKFALALDKEESFEYKEVTSKGIKFINLNAGRVTRLLSPKTLWNLLKVPLGFFKALSIITNEKPDAVLSFGGYIAVPVALSAFFLGVPVITHEQTVHPGFGNRLIGFFAKKVFVAFEEAKPFFSAKAVVVGNPIRSEVSIVQNKIAGFTKNRPVLFVVGGALGSHSVNIHIFKLLPKLLEKYIVIHQTGSSSEFGDDQRSKTIKDKNYFSFSHISSDQIGFIYRNTDLMVSRSGANTFFEILALRKPAILIPLPWSGSGEQEKHAQLLKQFHVAEVFDQSEASSELLSLIEGMFGSLEKYTKNFDTIDLPYDRKKAAEQIAKAVRKAATDSSSS